MPVATLTQTSITRPEELVEALAELVADSTLSFQYVAKYDEQLIPQYPAVLIQPAQFEKELHATHTFLITLRATIYVLHAKLTVSKQRRSLEDCQLATQLVNLLESDLHLGSYYDEVDQVTRNRVITGYVESEIPAALPPRSELGDAVVSTRLSWFGINERRFR